MNFSKKIPLIYRSFRNSTFKLVRIKKTFVEFIFYSIKVKQYVKFQRLQSFAFITFDGQALADYSSNIHNFSVCIYLNKTNNKQYFYLFATLNKIKIFAISLFIKNINRLIIIRSRNISINKYLTYLNNLFNKTLC